MRWNTFSQSVLFGGVAAAAFAVFALILSSRFGVEWSLVGFAACAIPIYLVGLAETRRRGAAAAMLAAGLIAGVVALDASPREALFVSALALGLARSGIAYPRAFARGVLIESMLGVGGLSVAGILIGTSTLSVVLAVWGFFLVQAVFFLIPRARPIRPAEAIDPFDEARDRANAILDDAIRGT